MKKILFAALLSAALLLTGCSSEGGTEDAQETARPEMTAPMFESRDVAFAMYDEVTFDDTKETLTQRYGEPTVETGSNGDIYYWRNDTCGVAIVFFENGRLRSKLVDFEDSRQFGKISSAQNLDSVLDLNNNATYDDICLVMGTPGIEFIRIAQDSSVNPEFSVGYLWGNEQGEEVKILFNRKMGIDQINYNLN